MNRTGGVAGESARHTPAVRARAGILMGLVVSIVALGAAVLAAPGRPGGGGRSTFEISGSVAPVYPIVDSTLVLKVENPERFTIIVTDLAVQVSDASQSCQAANLAVSEVPLPFEIPAGGETTIGVEVRLVDDAAQSCQGATFPLEYVGAAARG